MNYEEAMRKCYLENIQKTVKKFFEAYGDIRMLYIDIGFVDKPVLYLNGVDYGDLDVSPDISPNQDEWGYAALDLIKNNEDKLLKTLEGAFARAMYEEYKRSKRSLLKTKQSDKLKLKNLLNSLKEMDENED